jgi:hypothetical protein
MSIKMIWREYRKAEAKEEAEAEAEVKRNCN